MKGKVWTLEQEKQLKKLVEEKASLPAIAETLGKSLEAVRSKAKRLGLVDDDQKKKNLCSSTTTAVLVLPKELFSVEEVLKELHAAVVGLKAPGLDKTEVIRLRGIIAGCKVYKEMLADYMDYRGLEVELLEWRAKYEVLSKTANVQTNQLLNERFALRADGGLAFSHPQGTHDDVFWASVLAVYATCEMSPEPFLAGYSSAVM